MAELVLGIGMSHSPMVATDTTAWRRFGAVDRRSTFLRDRTGAAVSYTDLERTNGSRYAGLAESDHLDGQAAQVTRALDRLRADVLAAEVDVFIVIGDDQMELHDLDNMPALGIYYGDELVMATRSRFGTYYEDMADVLAEISRGYGMDQRHVFPGHGDLAVHLIASLIDQRFDVAAMRDVVADDHGIGHAFGIVEAQLMGDEKRPLVPVFINNYWPPNQLPPARCYELGLALRTAIEAYPGDLRVAVVASGGLSHFVTDEELDGRVLEALRAGDREALLAIPAEQLQSGNSEIRNWMTLAAACHDRQVAWHEYIPVYRTVVGTGCGLAFLRYS